MGVPRAKNKKKKKDKNKDKSYEEQLSVVQELHKAIMYLYDADVKKQTQEDILQKNKFFARTILSMSRGTITFDTILEKLEEHNIDLEEVGKKTDEYIVKYWDEWN